MDMSYVVNQSAVTDGNNNPVQRIVDAAPWGYDAAKDALKVTSHKLIEKEDLLRAQLYTGGRVFLYPMQELAGNVCYDYSEVGNNAQYNGVVFGKVGPSSKIDRGTRFTGSSYVVVPQAVSVRNKAAVTFECVVQVLASSGANRLIYQEPTADNGEKARFCLAITPDSKLSVILRTGLGTTTSQVVTATTAMTEGTHIVAVTVDIVAKEALLYVDGTAVTTTGTLDFGTDVAFADTEPKNRICFAAGQAANGTVLTSATPFSGVIAYAALYSRKLSAATLLAHAQAAGYAT